MLDVLQIILWSITYLLIVCFGIKYRKERQVMMPLLAGSLNFAWEINALLLSKGMWGHILWLGLDFVVLALNLYNIKKYKILYGLFIVVLTIVLRMVFTVPAFDGMLISVFTIDLIMAVDFAVNAKKISRRGKIPIAITKLLGDFFAWLAYSEYKFVNIIGPLVLLLNLYYLAMSLDQSSNAKRQSAKGDRRRWSF